MSRTIILSEEEKRNIKKMYGMINEQKVGDKAPLESLPKEIQDFVKRYNLQGYFNYSSVNGKIGERFGYNKGNAHSDTSVADIQTFMKNKGQISKCQEREKFYNDTLKKLMSGGGMSNDDKNIDPRMKEMCKRYPNDPECIKMNSGKRMSERDAREKATELTNNKFRNMDFCGVTMKVQRIIKM